MTSLSQMARRVTDQDIILDYRMTSLVRGNSELRCKRQDTRPN